MSYGSLDLSVSANQAGYQASKFVQFFTSANALLWKYGGEHTLQRIKTTIISGGGAPLWPRGRVPYRLETFEWAGVEEPIFADEQIENITQALGHIERETPCIHFLWVLVPF